MDLLYADSLKARFVIKVHINRSSVKDKIFTFVFKDSLYKKTGVIIYKRY